ncbi:MAG: hypothetical protein OXD30_14250 [Bryobacterales bacterium]|nr:hypothetical protein [Bryobacterales bacterium]
MMNDKGTAVATAGTGGCLGNLILNEQRAANEAIESLRFQFNQDFAVVRASIADRRERMDRL